MLCFVSQGGGLRPYPGLIYFALSGHGGNGIFLTAPTLQYSLKVGAGQGAWYLNRSVRLALLPRSTRDARSGLKAKSG